jgi:hexokinase
MTPAPAMANSLVAETKRIVAQFDYTNEDVNKGVQEFLRQMSMINPTHLFV